MTEDSLRSLLMRYAAVAAFAAIGVVSVLSAQVAATPVAVGAVAAHGHAIATPSAIAVAKRGPVTLDGRLDEDAWKQATPVSDFKQYDPDHDAPATERTEVRFLFDDDALYVGARLTDSQGPAGITSTVVRRDAFFNSDYFEVVIDGFHDHLGRAYFQVNPSGSRTDMLGVGNSCCDSGWDPVWEAKTSMDATGWSVEMRIPFSQLRFSRDSLQTWGLQIRRYLKRRQETDQWSMWTRTENGGPARFGHLEGLRIAHTTRNLELLPYVASQASRVQADARDPFHAGTHGQIRAGVDLKYLLTPNLTLDATVNPDFGQVEADPAVVNLSAFENFFEERRPFFVSSSGVFDFGAFNCHFCSNVSNLQAFYSRRVGRAPTGADLAYANGAYADVPQASPILGAAKITGRTSSGYTIGVLDAVSGKTSADISLASGARSHQEVEPLANYFVGRVKKDYKRGDLVIGAIVTSVERSLDAAFVPRLTRRADLVGIDWRYQWKDRVYSFMGSAAASMIEGDARVISAKQRSNTHLYQRPDREIGSTGFFGTRLDSTETIMRGYGAYARVSKEAGDWQWESAVNLRNPGFETNDYSFLQSADYVWNNANLLRLFTKPSSWYQQLFLIAGGQLQHNFEGDVTNNTDLHAYLGYGAPQFWGINAFVIHNMGNLIDDRLLRGGPSVRSMSSNFYSMNLSSDSRKQWQLNVSPQLRQSEDGTTRTSLSVHATVQPSTRTYFTFGPSISHSADSRQYVRAVADPTATTFGGSRYIVSTITQQQLGLDTRLNVTFTPRVTLELYVQPFIASGRYDQFKEFVAPRSNTVAVYGVDRGTIRPTTDSKGRVASYTIDPDGTGAAAPFVLTNPDFNLRSLRGSAVFRWEYRPGSTLYFVWTQQRSGQDAVGDFDFGRDRTALFAAKPDNVFLVKASWWLAR